MIYVSTRGDAPALPFEDVVLAGLARDGGLYVPGRWPRFTPDALRLMANLEYPALTARVMAAFAVPSMSEEQLVEIATDAYASFNHATVAPLKPLGRNEWILELFHGPTLAFKDYALQMLGRLFDAILKRRGERITVIGATSGDTGSAAIEACRDRDAVEIFMLHPRGRVSEVQRRQMTTVAAANVHNIAIDGTFDDCQDLVKAMFSDQVFRDRYRLSAVNSINWARIVAQIAYYVHAALALGAPDQKVTFAVPTGNFGNVFAGYAAARLGLPIRRLVIGSNRNDILPRFFATGRMTVETVHPTISPSMDIQVSSNFERLLFELYDRQGDAIRSLMATFRRHGHVEVDADRLGLARKLFCAARFDDEATTAIMLRVFEETGDLIDPHTAVGVAAARQFAASDAGPVVILGTAHPAKFPDAVEAATGVRPTLPERLATLMDLPERFDALSADLATVQHYIADTLERREAIA